jgi:hypothetical protein
MGYVEQVSKARHEACEIKSQLQGQDISGMTAREIVDGHWVDPLSDSDAEWLDLQDLTEDAWRDMVAEELAKLL